MLCCLYSLSACHRQLVCFYFFTLLLFYSFTLLLFYPFTFLPFYFFTLLLFYPFTFLLFYFFTFNKQACQLVKLGKFKHAAWQCVKRYAYGYTGAKFHNVAGDEIVYRKYQGEHREAEGDGWQQVLHLLEEADIDQLARIICVYRQRHERVEYLSVAHHNEAERGCDAKHAYAEDFLYDFKAQEEVWTAFNL